MASRLREHRVDEFEVEHALLRFEVVARDTSQTLFAPNPATREKDYLIAPGVLEHELWS